MELGVIADTHNQDDLCEKAIDIFNDTCDCVIHCGDFSSFHIFEMFLDQRFEFKYVIGDKHDDKKIKRYESQFVETPLDVDECLDFQRNGIRIGAFHDTYKREDGEAHSYVHKTISSGEFDYFFYGHLHFLNLKFPSSNNKTFALNPGSFYPQLEWEQDNTIPTFVTINTIKQIVSVYYYSEYEFEKIFEFEIKTRKIKRMNLYHTRIFFSDLQSYLDMNPKNYRYSFSDCPEFCWLNRSLPNLGQFFRGIGGSYLWQQMEPAGQDRGWESLR